VARKKKTEEKENVAPAPISPPVQDQDEIKVMALNENQLLKVLRAEAEVRASTAELQLHQLILEQTIKTIDPEGRIAAQAARVKGLSGAVVVARKIHEDTTDAVGKQLGVNLRKCSFDDVTGTVHVNE
jgi:hypothetical protein